jgi:hypothetical protein
MGTEHSKKGVAVYIIVMQERCLDACTARSNRVYAEHGSTMQAYFSDD